MYTIGQVSEMFDIPISTLRYYDKEGLFPTMERKNGIRRFGEAEIEALRVIDCLKASGLEIKDIKLFMDWCTEGPATYGQRKELFESPGDFSSVLIPEHPHAGGNISGLALPESAGAHDLFDLLRLRFRKRLY